MKETVQYRKMVYLTSELAEAWEAYKATHPEQSFNALVLQLLKEELCANNA